MSTEFQQCIQEYWIGVLKYYHGCFALVKWRLVLFTRAIPYQCKQSKIELKRGLWEQIKFYLPKKEHGDIFL